MSTSKSSGGSTVVEYSPYYPKVESSSPSTDTVTRKLKFIDIKRKNRLLKVYYVPATSVTLLAFFSFFLAVAINSTNETNKAGGMHH